MIYTSTFNPVLDVTVSVDSLQRGKMNMTEMKSISAGGKGLNVSRVLGRLGIRNKAIALCGGMIGRDIEKLLLDEGMDFQIIPIKENTRMSIKVTERKYGRMTQINNAGPFVSATEFKELRDFISGMDPEPSSFIMSGSLPPGIDETFYAEIINKCNKDNVKTLLDTSGKPLYYGIMAVPGILKITLDELKEVSDGYFNLEPARLIRKIIDDGTDIIMLTDGAGKVRFYDSFDSYIITPPRLEGLYPTGSGDCVSAGLLYALQNDFGKEDMVKFAVACGSANVLNEYPGRIDLEQISKLLPEIRVSKRTITDL
ncbi:MAG: hexose kinase [Actinobacteria bacterium]|nr:hexose kinase [Actinomycetota bacterium]